MQLSFKNCFSNIRDATNVIVNDNNLREALKDYFNNNLVIARYYNNNDAKEKSYKN